MPRTDALPGRDELYRLLVEHVTDYAIFLIRPDGRVEDWTEGAERMLGWTAGEVVGRHVSTFYPPEAVEAGTPERDLATAARQGRCESLAWRVRRGGERLWASVVLTAIQDAAGRLIGFGQITRDLTERREASERYEESRQRYRSLFEHNPEAVWSCGLDGHVLAGNPATRRLSGYDPAELAGTPLWSLVEPGDRPGLREAFREAAGGEPRRAAVTLVHRSGSEVEARAQLVPILVEERVIGVYCLAEDVTARHRADAEREWLLQRERQARAEAEAANRAKSDFLAVVSHELRTPLNVITGYADLLGDGVVGPLSATQARHVGRIRASARHLVELIDEVIGYARMEAGAEGVEMGRVDLPAVVREAVEKTRPSAAQRGLAVRVVAEGDPALLVVDTDRTKALRILRHLLANAVKFTADGEVCVRVAREDGHALVEVRDTGTGIDPAHLEKIWEPFWQAEHPTVRRAGGTGLGLSVARRLSELLGGELRVRSRPGEGSAFTLVLPALRPVPMGTDGAETLDSPPP